MADFFANGRAARFAQYADAITERSKAFGEQFHLRGLAATFRAFKCDE